MPCLKIVACTVPEETVTQSYPKKNKRKNGQIEERIRAIDQILNPKFQQSLPICIPSFKILAFTVPEKSVPQVFNVSIHKIERKRNREIFNAVMQNRE